MGVRLAPVQITQCLDMCLLKHLYPVEAQWSSGYLACCTSDLEVHGSSLVFAIVLFP